MKNKTRTILTKRKKENIKVAIAEHLRSNPLNLAATFRHVSNQKRVPFGTIQGIWYREMAHGKPMFITMTNSGVAINRKTVDVKQTKKNTVFGYSLLDIAQLSDSEKVAFIDMILS